MKVERIELEKEDRYRLKIPGHGIYEVWNGSYYAESSTYTIVGVRVDKSVNEVYWLEVFCHSAFADLDGVLRRKYNWDSVLVVYRLLGEVEEVLNEEKNS